MCSPLMKRNQSCDRSRDFARKGRRASCNQTGFGKAGGRYRRKGRQLALQSGNNKSKGRRRRLKEAVSVAYERVYVSGAPLFCRTFLAGVFLAVCYDVLRIIRKIIVHTSFWMGMEDIFYWCFTGVFLFFVIYTENNGVIRSYALLAIGAGALVYRAGPGKVLLNLAVRLMEKILTPIRKWRKRLN